MYFENFIKQLYVRASGGAL